MVNHSDPNLIKMLWWAYMFTDTLVNVKKLSRWWEEANAIKTMNSTGYLQASKAKSFNTEHKSFEFWCYIILNWLSRAAVAQ